MNEQIQINKNSTVLYNNLFDSKYEIGVRLQDFNVGFEEHYHNYIEIVCQLNNTSTQIVNGVEYKLQESQMLIIHPGEAHENVASESTVLNLIVSDKFLSNLVIDSAFDDTLIHIKNVISSSGNTEVYTLPKTTTAILFDIYYLLLEQSEITMYYLRQKINITNFFISLEEISTVMNKQIQQNKLDLISYIETNLATASLNDFSRISNYSPSLISQRIKSQYEMSFVEILQELRIKHAVRMLTETNKNIDTIMSEIGYSNKTHFYAIFKEKFNQTPSVYRKSHIK